MAKFAVLFFAALAFHAAFAGVRRHYNQDLSVGYQTGKWDEYIGQIQGATNDISVSLQNVQPGNKLVGKTLIWQSRELVQVVDVIINKLQTETNVYNAEVDKTIQRVLGELSEIQATLQQILNYTDVSNVGQLKNQLNTCIQGVAEQIEKLVVLVKGGLTDAQGSLYATIRDVLDNYLTVVESIQSQVKLIGQDVQSWQGPKQLGVQIQETTGVLTSFLQDATLNTRQVKLALGEFARNIEIIVRKLETEVTVGNKDVDTVLQLLCNELRQLLLPLRQVVETDAIVDVDGLRLKLTGYLQNVAAITEQLVQAVQVGSQRVQVDGLVQQVLYEYWWALKQVRLQIQGGQIIWSGSWNKGIAGQSDKGLTIQIQAIVSDLTAVLQKVHVDNVVVRQTLVSLIQQYIRNLEIIVERLLDTPQVGLRLKQSVLPLERIIGSGVAVNTKELINELCLCIQTIAGNLEKLNLGSQTNLEWNKGISTDATRGVLVQFLTITRNLSIQIQSIAQVGQTGTGLEIQIQTLANGLTAALQSITVDNQEVVLVLVQESRELARYLETIVERLQTAGVDLPSKVVLNLRQIIGALQQANIEGVGSAQQLKWKLITCIQEAAVEIQKLAWLGLEGSLSEILGDFVVVLQNLQIQLQNVYQFGKYGQGPQQLAVQIQAITNNLAIFLQNVPSNGELVKQKLEVQAKRLAQNIEVIIQRLQVETNGIGAVQQIVSRLRQIVTVLEKVAVWESSTSVYGLVSQLNVVLQTVASELKRLALLDNGVVRSVLVQYLNVIQQVQVQLQTINQTVQIGQTPRELALQIEGVARRLVGMLRVVVPDNRQTQNALVYQARRLSQILDIIVRKLQTEIGAGNGIVLQVANTLKQIQVSLQQRTVRIEVVNSYQLKIQLATLVQDAAIEIQKLVYVGQTDVQLIRSVLIDFLAGLQNLQVQIQDNLQIVLNGQSPRTLVIQIQTVAQRLSVYLQYVQPNSQQLRQTLVIQIGELAQTIENIIQLLQTQIKNTGESSVVLKQVYAELNQISLSLQQILGVETVPVIELSHQLNLNIRNVVEVIQRLAYIADFELQQIQVGTNHSGVLNGVFNNVLACLRNIFIQLANARQIGTFGLKTDELANQIQTVTNHLTQSLELVGASTKQVKQALAIQALRYALRIQRIVDRLETEANHGIGVGTIQQIVQNLRQVVVALQQIGGSWTSTSTTVDIRTQLNTQVQNVAAQIQKLLVAESGLQGTLGPVGVIVKSVLIEYLATVQSLNIRIQNIAQISQKGQNLYQLVTQIDTAVSDLTTYFQRVLPSNHLVGKTIVVEARQLIEVIANIINKLQAGSGVGINGLVQHVISQLRQVELSLEQIVGEQVVANTYQLAIQLEVNIQRAAVAIQQLAWAVQPEQVQISTGTITVVREVLSEFLAAVQNTYIQVYNAVPIDQIRRLTWGSRLQAQQGLGLQGEGWGAGLQGEQAWGLGLQGEQGWERGLQGYGWGVDLQEQRGLGIQGQSWGAGLQGQQGWGVGLRGQGWARQGLLGLGGVRGDWVAESPKQLLVQIREVVGRLLNILQSTGLNGQEARQIITVQVDQLSQIIDVIVGQLQEAISVGSENIDVTVLKQVIIRLREVDHTLRQIVGYSTSVTRLESCIQTVVAQIEKLAYVIQGVPQGRSAVIIKNVLGEFLTGVQQIVWQLQGVGVGLKGWNQLGVGNGVGVGGWNRFGVGAEGWNQLGVGNGVGDWNQLGDWGLQGGAQGLSWKQLIHQIQILANNVAQELQTVGTNDKQLKQVVIVQARQLVQVIDNIIDRLQAELAITNVQQVIRVLKQIQLEVQQIASTGVFTTVYQIRSQFSGVLENIALQLKKLGWLIQSDVQIQGAINVVAKNVLVQYLVFLRNLQTQLQGSTLSLRVQNSWEVPSTYGRLGQNDQSLWGSQGIWGRQGQEALSGKQLINQIQILARTVAQQLQTVGINDKEIKQVIIVQARELLQIIDNIIDRLQVQVATTNIQQVIRIFRQIQVELQQITSTGALTTVYQIRAQFVSVIENIALQLDKLGWVSQSGVQVKNVLVQYLVFLRNLEDQLQVRTRGLGLGGSQWSNDVSGRLGKSAWGVRDNVWGSRWGAGEDLDEDLDVLGGLEGSWANRKVIRGF